MRLCRVEELRQRGTLEVRLSGSGEVGEAFLVYRDGDIYGYLNQCPHTGAPLNWSPHVFLSAEGTFIQCSLHGALFRIDDGYCEYGPCSGEGLIPLTISSEGDAVVLASQVPGRDSG
jgi:nitrite reductase/ring-hydroxylating ferredoxin subunit